MHYPCATSAKHEASGGARTRDLRTGRPTLYQLSYTCMNSGPDRIRTRMDRKRLSGNALPCNARAHAQTLPGASATRLIDLCRPAWGLHMAIVCLPFGEPAHFSGAYPLRYRPVGVAPLIGRRPSPCSLSHCVRLAHPSLCPMKDVMNENWSGRQDLNLRPHAPQACALPDCATPR
jgi:hypothetical protein